MKLTRRFLLFKVYLAFLSCLLLAAIYISKHLGYNFDMLGYIAIVVRMDKSHSIDEIHSLTYPTPGKEFPHKS